MNVVLLAFNRPALTERVFDRIRLAKPEKLLIVIDGPRSSCATDAEMISSVRSIVEGITWPCAVYQNVSPVNLGCRRRVASGLDWAFGVVDEAIILEDDCLPDLSFFSFCEEMLSRHRDEDRVMHVSGDNFQNATRKTGDSYYFSKYPHIWGWATWRRAWKHYDLGMTRWPELRDSGWLAGICPDEREQQYWTGAFNKAYSGEIDTWDYAWTFACWVNKGVSILPAVNLVENIGFGEGATHTASGQRRGPLVGDMVFPLRHSGNIHVNETADRYTFKTHFDPSKTLQEKMSDTVMNRHWYGQQIRQLPVLGTVWTQWRHSRRGLPK